MTAVDVALVLATAATVIIVWSSWRQRLDLAQLGTVSQQWLAERRANDRQYSQR